MGKETFSFKWEDIGTDNDPNVTEKTKTPARPGFATENDHSAMVRSFAGTPDIMGKNTDTFLGAVAGKSLRDKAPASGAMPAYYNDLPGREAKEAVDDSLGAGQDRNMRSILDMMGIFPYLRTAAEGLSNDSPEGNAMRRALQQYYGSAAENAPDAVKVLSNTGGPVSALMSTQKALRAGGLAGGAVLGGVGGYAGQVEPDFGDIFGRAEGTASGAAFGAAIGKTGEVAGNRASAAFGSKPQERPTLSAEDLKRMMGYEESAPIPNEELVKAIPKAPPVPERPSYMASPEEIAAQQQTPQEIATIKASKFGGSQETKARLAQYSESVPVGGKQLVQQQQARGTADVNKDIARVTKKMERGIERAEANFKGADLKARVKELKDSFNVEFKSLKTELTEAQKQTRAEANAAQGSKQAEQMAAMQVRQATKSEPVSNPGPVAKGVTAARVYTRPPREGFNAREAIPGFKEMSAEEKTRAIADYAHAPERERLGELPTYAMEGANARDPNSLKTALEKSGSLKYLDSQTKQYYNDVSQYLFRYQTPGKPVDTSRPYANAHTQAYMDLTGGKVGEFVSKDVFYKKYLAEFDKRNGMIDVNEGLKRKSPEKFDQHLDLYGREIGQPPKGLTPLGVPDQPLVWVRKGDKVALSPYFPNETRGKGMDPDIIRNQLDTNPEIAKLPDKDLNRMFGSDDASTIRKYWLVDKMPVTEGMDALARLPRQDRIVPAPDARQSIAAGSPLPTQQQQARAGGTSGIPQPRGPRGGKLPAGKIPPVPQPAPKGSMALRAWDAVQKIASPSTVSGVSRKAAQVIRSQVGEGLRNIHVNAEKFETSRKDINRLPEPDRLEMLHYIQTGGRKGKIDPQYKDLVDDLKAVYAGYEKEMASLPRFTMQQFMNDYLPNLWKDKIAAQGVIRAGTYLKQRRIMTYDEGIERGLTPLTTDPIEITMKYMASMRGFLDRAFVLQEAKNLGHVRYLKAGRDLPVGARLLDGTARSGTQAYASEDFARVYNNWVSRGFAGISEDYGNLYQGIQRITNFSTSMKLGLSGFHAVTMTKEAFLAEIGMGVTKAARGDIAGAAKSLAKAPAAFVNYYRAGDKLMNVYLKPGQLGHLNTAKSQQMAGLLAKTGLTVKGLDDIYKTTAVGDFWTSFKRGSLGNEARATAHAFKSALTPDTMTPGGVGKAALRTGKESIKATYELAARTIETVAQPLFYHYIPRLKVGAWQVRMSDYLERNPTASMEKQIEFAQHTADVIDDQFGELAQGNIFWNNTAKQSLNVLLTSTGWTTGTIRLFGQGAFDLARATAKTATTGQRQELSQRSAYTIATVIGLGAIGQTYQVLLGSGETIKDARDAVAPKTGGVTDRGAPERALLPGYEKDIIGYNRDAVQEGINKLNPFLQTVIDLARNKDYRNDPIRSPIDPTMKQVQDVAKRMLETVTPISVRTAGDRKYEGSKINMTERIAGIRSAPTYLTDPERDARGQARRDRLAAKKKVRNERRDKIKAGTYKWEDVELAPPRAQNPSLQSPNSFKWDDIQ